MTADGKNLREAAHDIFQPAAGVWSKKKGDPLFFVKPPVDYSVWPAFDMLPDGRFVVSKIDIRETGLWAVDLTYKEK